MAFRVTKKDLDKADTSGGRWDRPCAPGLYEGTIVFGDDHQSNAGKEGLKFTFVTSATPEAAPEGPVKIDYYVASAWGAKNFLEAFDPATLAAAQAAGEEEEIEIEAAEWVDHKCAIKVVSEKYEGSVRPKISSLLPLSVLSAANKAKPQGQPAPAPASQAGAAGAAADDDDDDDTPF